MKRARLDLLAASLAVATLIRAQPGGIVVSSDADIRRILTARIDDQRQSLGIVVGVTTPGGRRVITYGHPGRDDPRPLTADTVFEIGSVTKIFTSLVLADMVGRKEASVSEPITQFLPATLNANRGQARSLTLTDLATHTSGMPFWPSNLEAGETFAVLARYTVDELYDFAARFDPPPDAGIRWAYSNVDAGLLGALLARRAGSTYESLVAERVTGPLGMPSTAVTPSPSMVSRMAKGHDAKLDGAPSWKVPALEGAGSLLSSAHDLMTLLEGLAADRSAIAHLLPTMLGTRRQGPGFEQALGWMVLQGGTDGEIIYHDGQTLGFAAAVAFEPRSSTGVVVLSNAASGVGDIARHLLRPAIPLATPAAPAPRRTEIVVDPALFDRYAGHYEPGPGVVFTVSREGDSLMLQLPGLPKLRLRPETERDFFVAENTRITVTFDVDPSGRVTRLLLKAPTGDVPATRADAR
jgi:D-alanyl-D-alanine-carboxypeptidase/D-alanyl-D-alanine-endopeptidase